MNYKTKAHRCLGIDPGIGNCGWAVVHRKAKSRNCEARSLLGSPISAKVSTQPAGCEDTSLPSSKFTLIEKGTIKTQASEEQPHRLENIYAGVSELLRQHAPDVVVIEAIFFNRNIKSCISTASVIAVIELACRHADIPSKQIKPQTLKSAVTGNGRATKEQVKFMIGALLKKEVKSHHEADAAAAAIAGLQTTI